VVRDGFREGPPPPLGPELLRSLGYYFRGRDDNLAVKAFEQVRREGTAATTPPTSSPTPTTGWSAGATR
jgi:hypothetical protein